MRRSLHSVIGLGFSLLVSFSAVTGALLAVGPVQDRFFHLAPELENRSVADLVADIARRYPTTESVSRSAAGEIIVHFVSDGDRREVAFDPATGSEAPARKPSDPRLWLTDWHRSLGGGDAFLGRSLTGFAALGSVLIALSGVILLSGRMGGMRHLTAAVRGTRAERIHVILGRASIAGLLLASATGLYLSAAFFGAVPSSKGGVASFPDDLSGAEPLPIQSLAALDAIPASQLHSLVFPFDGDPFEPFEIRTRYGMGFVDQATGELASWRPLNLAEHLHHLVLILHTGEGLWLVALFTGLSALSVPVLGFSGTVVWWRRRAARPRLRRNVPAEDSDTVILVGSEGNTTWGFAYALQDALSAEGHFVHVAPMNRLGAEHLGDRMLFLLTATYGDGSAPSSADAFLDKLSRVEGAPERGVAVLGFGDREFDQYCRFAEEVQAAVSAREWRLLHPFATVNRKSPQEFARWGEALGRSLGVDLRLVHIAEAPRLKEFRLLEKKAFEDVPGARTAILRFSPDNGRKLPGFEAGDLMAIVPPGSTMPRYYSLGSSAADGFLEIAVRRHPEGQCSRYLHNLENGHTVRAFVRRNPEFHLRAGKSPVILIGSGCGMGVLAGFIRANRDRRPMRLYYGTRNPDADFLYRTEMQDWIVEGRLSALVLSATGVTGDDLQDKIAQDGSQLANSVRQGARIMVVGGREMAEAVRQSLEAVLDPLGLSVSELMAKGDYVEDVF